MALNLEEQDEALEDKPTLAEDLMRTIVHTMTGSTLMITILQIRVLTSLVPTIPSHFRFFDGPPRDYGPNNGTRHVRGMRSEGSRHGLSILMITETHGNFELYKSPSSSIIKKKYYTPVSHNDIFDGFFCSENPKHAMYHYHVQGLIIPHHYYICMFRLIKQLSTYSPKQITRTDTGLIINAKFPVTRCEFATVPLQPVSRHIDYRIRHPKCRFNWV